MIDTRVHRGSKAYGITAGELHESGVSMHAIRARVQNNDLEDGDELLNEILEDLNQTELSDYHWKGVNPRTTHNPLGRNLKLYCLWELERSRSELEFLENLIGSFSQAKQIKNTQDRINTERELHDHLLALALELDLQDNGGSDSEESIAQVQSAAGQDADLHHVFTDDGNEVEYHPYQTIEQGVQALPTSTNDNQASLPHDDIDAPLQTQEDFLQNKQRTIGSAGSGSGTGQIIEVAVDSEPLAKEEPGSKRTAGTS